MKTYIILVFASLFIALGNTISKAQELRCNVIINTDQLSNSTSQVAEKQLFTDMQRTMTEFMNTRKWTNDKFNNEERIKCNIMIRITNMPTAGTFEGTAQIQSARPVYGSDYESILLNFIDREWQFQFSPSQTLEFNDNSFNNNLTSLLAFYAYIIIGLDYDSFGKLGGSTYLQRAMNIATIAQQGVSTEKGWKPFEDIRNRYWLVENLTNQQMQPIREGLYVYHRKAMDTFATNPEQSRAQVLEVLNTIKKVNQQKPAAVLTNTFFDTKINELINIFLQGSPQDKQKAYNLLVELDPTKTDKYNKLTQ